MGKHKDGKKHKKGSQLVIRVDKAERDAFVGLCDALDTSAAREIRRFMRDWVATNTPEPVPDREEAGGLAASSDAAPAEMSAVEVDEIVAGAAEPAIAAKSDTGDAAASKARRAAAKRQ